MGSSYSCHRLSLSSMRHPMSIIPAVGLGLILGLGGVRGCSRSSQPTYEVGTCIATDHYYTRKIVGIYNDTQTYKLCQTHTGYGKWYGCESEESWSFVSDRVVPCPELTNP